MSVVDSTSLHPAPGDEHEDDAAGQHTHGGLAEGTNEILDETEMQNGRDGSGHEPELSETSANDKLAAVMTQDEKPTATKSSTTAKAKPSISVKPPVGKSVSSPSTPLVKKIINSGTFGAGAVKSAVTKGATASVTAAKSASSAPAASALRRTTSAAPTAAKTATVSRAPAAPARRASVAPSASTISKPPLSASTNTKAAPNARTTATSPTGSVGSLKSGAGVRPRASVSEGIKKAHPVSRQSLSTATKPPVAKPTVTSRSSAAPPKSRSGASISSIREVKEDTKLSEGLQEQLNATIESLKEKDEIIGQLGEEVEKLKASLTSAMTDAEAKATQVADLDQSKAAIEVQLRETIQSLEELQNQQLVGDSAVESSRVELQAAKEAALSSQKLIKDLELQNQALGQEVAAAKSRLDELQATHALSSSDAAAAASVEHEALLKAQADLKAIAEETESLKVSYDDAQKERQTRIAELEAQLVEVEALQAQVNMLKAEKDENANKFSELEIEILELKESQEVSEDERQQLQNRIRALEEDLLKSSAALKEASESSSTKEQMHISAIQELQIKHDEELKAAAERHSEVINSLQSLKSDLEASMTAHEQTKKDGLVVGEVHASAMKKAEEDLSKQEAELSAKIADVTAKLEGQEAQYNSKLETIKAEYETSLQEAFERAKHEAGDAHTQELQALRAESTLTIEQVQAANRVSLETLKAEHASELETTVNDLKKQITSLSLDLKATQDDLAKSKASVEAARAEILTLTTQRDEARAAAESTPITSPEHIAETARLTSELSNTKDDLAAITDQLNLTKSSLSEMSDRHALELQEAAQVRANEAIKLRSAHDEEITSLAKQKSDLLVKLTDLEGELATAKAALEAQANAPRSNGNGAVSPSSPGVTKEELHKMHEAHNLKVYDMQAEHDKIIKGLKEELEAVHIKVGELQQEVGRKAMEIQYLEQDQDETQEQITRLKEDNEALVEKLKKVETNTFTA